MRHVQTILWTVIDISVISASVTLAIAPASETARLLAIDVAERNEAQAELLALAKTYSAASTNIVCSLTALIANPANSDLEKHPGNSDAVRRAIVVLGELRAVEAIPTLVAHITVINRYGLRDDLYRSTSMIGQPPRQYWPAVAALINIGEPSLPAVIEKLATTQDLEEANACRAVLTEILGPKVAIKKLQDAIAGEKNAHRQSRLQIALQKLSIEQKTLEHSTSQRGL